MILRVKEGSWSTPFGPAVSAIIFPENADDEAAIKEMLKLYSETVTGVAIKVERG